MASQSGAKLLTKVYRTVGEYVVLPDKWSQVACTLWVASTHMVDWMDHAPRLVITAPEPECGKTTLMNTLRPLSYNAIGASGVSESVLFRLIEDRRPTLFFDEAHKLLGQNSDRAKAVQGILDSGHSRSYPVWRAENFGQDLRPFDVFGFVAVAGNGTFYPELETRSVVVRMDKQPPGTVRYLRADDEEKLGQLGKRLNDWIVNVDYDWTQLPREVDLGNGRRMDNWRTLYKVADAAGGGWPTIARQAAREISRSDSRGAQISIAKELINDIGRFLATRAPDEKHFKSLTIVDFLNSLTDAPWSELETRKGMLTANKLARMLKPYKVEPEPNSRGSARGYYRADLARLVRVYGTEPSEPSNRQKGGADQGE